MNSPTDSHLPEQDALPLVDANSVSTKSTSRIAVPILVFLSLSGVILLAIGSLRVPDPDTDADPHNHRSLQSVGCYPGCLLGNGVDVYLRECEYNCFNGNGDYTQCLERCNLDVQPQVDYCSDVCFGGHSRRSLHQQEGDECYSDCFEDNGGEQDFRDCKQDCLHGPINHFDTCYGQCGGMVQSKHDE